MAYGIMNISSSATPNNNNEWLEFCSNVFYDSENIDEDWDGNYPSGELVDAVLPDSYPYDSLRMLCFYGCVRLKSMTLPDTITRLNGECFESCMFMEKFSAPQATTLGNECFYYCSALTSIELPQATTLGNYCFGSCLALTSIELSDNCDSIGTYAFYNCTSLKDINLGDTVITTLGTNTFYKCTALENIEIPSTVTTINSNAFNGCTQDNLIITIHKAEDSISGAPWGATNATIVWDGE